MPMLAALLLAAAPDAPPTDDIVVEGVRAMRFALARDGQGRLMCGLSRSSGVNAVDERLCDMARLCARKPTTPLEKVAACIDRKKPKLIAELKSARSKTKDRLNYHAFD